MKIFISEDEKARHPFYKIMELKGAIDGDFNIDGFNQ